MIGSLFSGIGGLELGLERAGLGVVAWQVEQDEWCRSVLARHWPEAARYNDVRSVGAATLARVRVLCGGFPCQDVSSAGKHAGLSGARSGLWYEYLRIVGELQPDGVVVENVTSGESAWLPFVRHDLLSAGYVSEAYRVAASDVGAPHRRMRTFVVAYRHGAGEPQPQGGERHERRRARHGGSVAHGHGHGLEIGARKQGDSSAQLQAAPGGGHLRGPGGAVPVSDMGRDAHGFPGGLDGHAFPAARGEAPHPHEPPRTVARGSDRANGRRLKALGNAVVPQCAELVGRILAARLETSHV